MIGKLAIVPVIAQEEQKQLLLKLRTIGDESEFEEHAGQEAGRRTLEISPKT